MRSMVIWSLVTVAFWSHSAGADCTVSHETPTGPITPTENGQRFAFTAIGDCQNLVWGISNETRGLTSPAHVAPRTGPGPQWYSVRITSVDLAYWIEPGMKELEWSIYQERRGDWTLLSTMTNEIDMDGDGATRTDGDHLLCDADPARSPFFSEVCGNNIDDDCDGVSERCE